jgi:hypothetical protein
MFRKKTRTPGWPEFPAPMQKVNEWKAQAVYTINYRCRNNDHGDAYGK